MAQPAAGQASLVVNQLVFVAADGTPSENCQNLEAARAAITDESASKPYLLSLEPGVYDCGLGGTGTEPWLSIEGSGTATVIQGNPGDAIGVVEIGSNSELRSVKVVRTGESPLATFAPAVSAFFGPVTDSRLFDVQAVSEGEMAWRCC